MILWTVMDPAVVFADESVEPPKHVTIDMGGAKMVVSPVDLWHVRVERLISPRAQDYLDPRLQPGSLLRLRLPD
ncbi:MAG: YlzJ-like family protein [Firmicutes bacterium]|nr:YlzJ-like family protein [Bacillota bacterium]